VSPLRHGAGALRLGVVVAALSTVTLSGCSSSDESFSLSAYELSEQVLEQQLKYSRQARAYVKEASARIDEVVGTDSAGAGYSENDFESDLSSLDVRCLSEPDLELEKPSVECVVVGQSTSSTQVPSTQLGQGYTIVIDRERECWDATAEDGRANVAIVWAVDRMSTCRALTGAELNGTEDFTPAYLERLKAQRDADNSSTEATPNEPATPDPSPPESSDPAASSSDRRPAPSSLDRAPSQQTVDSCVGDFTQRQTESERTREFLTREPDFTEKAYGWLEFFTVDGPCRVVIVVPEGSLTFDQLPEGGWTEGYEAAADTAERARPAQAFTPDLGITPNASIELAPPSGP